MYSTKNPSGLIIVYDGECIFCDNYIKLQSLRKSVGIVTLLDARSNPDIVATLHALNMDINQGMAALYKGEWHFGSECMTLLSTLSRGDTILGKIWRVLFSNSKVSAHLYPYFKAIRNFILKLQRKKKILPVNENP
jgi:predicted DCC family thiol-disulfide oxidoreductase YuxK